MPMSVLRSSSLALLALGACVIGQSAALRAQPADAHAQSRAIVLGPHPLLFVDDSGLTSSQGAVRRIHQATTHPSPVLEAEHPWEGARVYIYGSVYEAADGGYRMWYGSRPLQESPTQRDGRVPGLRGDGFDVVLYAESQDGLHWRKPALDRHAFAGQRGTNILFDLHSPSVLRDARERDPQKRYKMLGTFRGKYYAAYSADGLTWHDYPKNPVLDHSDTITLSQDPFTGEYLAFHKKPATVRGHPRRVVWLSRSPEMQTWTEPELVFAPDEHDDAWTRRPVERTEVYNMSVYPHAGGFIGLPTIFRVHTERPRAEVAPGQSPVDGPIDVEFTTSRDGRTWTRTSRRTAVIPRGAPGTFDAGAILGVSSVPVHTDRETWVYYTALTTGHGAPMPAKRIAIGRASWRRHGFASLDAGPDGGEVVTAPLTLSGPTLVVNADASRGSLCAAIQETDGTPVAGLGFDTCVPLDRDETLWDARWTSGARVPTDRPVRIALRLLNARLYSLDAR